MIAEIPKLNAAPATAVIRPAPDAFIGGQEKERGIKPGRVPALAIAHLGQHTTKTAVVLLVLPAGAAVAVQKPPQSGGEDKGWSLESVADDLGVIGDTGLYPLREVGTARLCGAAPVTVEHTKLALYILRRIFESADIHE